MSDPHTVRQPDRGGSMTVQREPTRRPTAARFAHRLWSWPVFAALSLLARTALAQEEKPLAPSLPEASDDGAAPEMPDEVTPDERIAELTERLQRDEDERHKSAPALTWNGYVDFGYFAPIGNGGAGWIRDSGNIAFPQYSQYSWVFLGDILGTPVNTRGEVASLGNAPGIQRFDS